MAGDLAEPDLWAQIESDERVFAAAFDDDLENSPFTPAEQGDIAARLQVLETAIRESKQLSAEQARLLEGRMEQLKEASLRLGRKDWLALFLGVMLSLVVTAALPPETVQALTLEFLYAIQDMFGAGPDNGPPLLPDGGPRNAA